jgi:peptide/nickel transport system permease protein
MSESQIFRKLGVGGVIGLSILFFDLLLLTIGPALAPYSETAMVTTVWAPPSAAHWLGADQLGRDMLSRLIYGARPTIGISFAATVLAFIIGVTLGFAAGIGQGWLDQILSRTSEAILAIPTLILGLVVISVLGTDLVVLVAVIAVLASVRVYRLSRALAMDIATLDFVENARLRGEKTWWLIREEILPNAMKPLMAEFGLRFCFAFLFIATLSFLGLGIQPPFADWGGMVTENAGAIIYGISAPLFPAAAIALTAIGVNLVVDGAIGDGTQVRTPHNVQ